VNICVISPAITSRYPATAPYNRFDLREGKFNRIIVRRVCRKIQNTTTPAEVRSTTWLLEHRCNLPLFDQFPNARMAMDACIVHNNYRVWGREWVHSIEEAIDELKKQFGGKRALNDLGIKHAVEG
jgi:hypothetical protein